MRPPPSTVMSKIIVSGELPPPRAPPAMDGPKIMDVVGSPPIRAPPLTGALNVMASEELPPANAAPEIDGPKIVDGVPVPAQRALGCFRLRGQSSLLFPGGQLGLELGRGNVPQR